MTTLLGDTDNRHINIFTYMNTKTTAGVGLVASNSIIRRASSAAGIAKTGTSIGTLHGAAHTSATAAWIGLGSMKIGLFVINVLPIVGGLLILDSLCGQGEGSSLIDWYEESWKQYEAHCEMEALKETVKVDPDHRIAVRNHPSSLSQQESLFQSLEVEHELYLLKKNLGLL